VLLSARLNTKPCPLISLFPPVLVDAVAVCRLKNLPSSFVDTANLLPIL
jgi:hypothetical protein